MGCRASKFENATRKDHRRSESTTACSQRSRDTSSDEKVYSSPHDTMGSESSTDSKRRSSEPAKSETTQSFTPMDPGMFITQQRVCLADRFIKEKKLGSGAYGEVMLCHDKHSGAARAVKILKKSSITSNVGALLDEVAVVKQLDHPNIMKLYEFLEDSRNFYLVMDVYWGGELFDEIISRQKFTEVDAAVTIKQVLSGVTYLHRHHIVHRDLKPENLLLESKAPDSPIRIVDFGLSAFFDTATKLKERLGTAYYIAPEVLKQKYDEKCDVWSIGVILYILLCGYPPFGGSTDREILHRVERGKYRFDSSDWDPVSPDAKDLIVRMLTLAPEHRISAEAALSHPWIREMTVCEKGTVQDHQLASALGNMRKFQASQKLAQAALFFMGSKLTTLEETKELTKIFRTLDVNGDGQLDRNELIEGYQLLRDTIEGSTGEVSREEIEEEVDKILECIDFDRNGFVEYSEFVTVAMDRNTLLSKDRLRAAFNMFDQDGSGTIAADELRRILVAVNDAQWNAIIREVDTNDDGEVDFDEFVAMMQQLCYDRDVAAQLRLQQ